MSAPRLAPACVAIFSAPLPPLPPSWTAFHNWPTTLRKKKAGNLSCPPGGGSQKYIALEISEKRKAIQQIVYLIFYPGPRFNSIVFAGIKMRMMRVPHKVTILTCSKVLSGMSFNQGFYVTRVFLDPIKCIKKVYLTQKLQWSWLRRRRWKIYRTAAILIIVRFLIF